MFAFSLAINGVTINIISYPKKAEDRFGMDLIDCHNDGSSSGLKLTKLKLLELKPINMRIESIIIGRNNSIICYTINAVKAEIDSG